MPKDTSPKKEVRKIPKNFRLFAEDVRRLKLGAEKMGIPAAIYLQFALREKFEKDGISLTSPTTSPTRPTTTSPAA